MDSFKSYLEYSEIVSFPQEREVDAVSSPIVLSTREWTNYTYAKCKASKTSRAALHYTKLHNYSVDFYRSAISYYTSLLEKNIV